MYLNLRKIKIFTKLFKKHIYALENIFFLIKEIFPNKIYFLNLKKLFFTVAFWCKVSYCCSIYSLLNLSAQPVSNLFPSTQVLPSDLQADLQNIQLDAEPLPDLRSYDLMAEGDVDQLSLEIEKERVDYWEKSKHLQEQLRELRSEIEVMKVGEKQCELDQLHEEQVRLGENKYSTLKKVKSGSTKARVAFFEEL